LKEHNNSNIATWDRWADLHLNSTFYGLESFLFGKSTLCQPERELLGDLCNKKLLHLQCHFGLDTLSLGRLGAIVTGIDFSEKAIANARCIADKAQISAEFYCEDVLQLSPTHLDFDIVFSSYGFLCWLSNLDKWASNIFAALRKGGKFVCVEFHPILEVFYKGKMTGAQQYFSMPEPSLIEETGSYAVPDANVKTKQFLWQYSLSSVLSALIKAGFRINVFKEYDYCSFGLFDNLVLDKKDGLFKDPYNPGKYPYMYSIVAEKTTNKTGA
tara:strand:+ start:365 stop:1177 length:813 start_codon:yes stop_codon:yes gene_type:complete